ncbi:2OG-Fe(II) oxygenase [Reinekea sp.]|uniref:2OG-Fe(II) oxygenase n=1 Tax=Reinekea sp. TaxID=1970455 RepID=UPI002A806D33|nr:2OG-Fe(II) oxygenase [Reinekea sp.]
MPALTLTDNHPDDGDHPVLFENISRDLLLKGYSINPYALPLGLAEELWQHLQQMPNTAFANAGIGRQQAYSRNGFVRSNLIAWIQDDCPAEQHWLQWATGLQSYLNRRLFLGLFSFESHFAHYATGDFYKRHLDAFKGQANRVISLIVYLNRDWNPSDGGELMLYQPAADQDPLRVTPTFGTVVAFLSEDFPHEVLPARRDRYSIAGWYRLNSSHPERVDPPS